jgi:protoporphyrinogen oxidase
LYKHPQLDRYMERREVAIIGAGPAGLTAGYFLAQRNVHSTIYEATSDCGGLGGSVNMWNKDYDIGPHIFLESSEKAAVEFWKEIGKTDLHSMPLRRGMILNRKQLSFPPKPGDLLKALQVKPFCLAAWGFFWSRFGPTKKYTDSGSFFESRYGRYFRAKVFSPFCLKYLGIPDTEVDKHFALNLTAFVKQSGKKEAVPDQTKLNTLLFPTGGTKMMWNRIAERYQETGEITCKKRVVNIGTHGNRISTIHFSDGTTVKPDQVVSTLSLPVLLHVLDVKSEEISHELTHLQYRNTVLVYLRINAPAFPFHYITVFDHSLEAGRITNFNVWTTDANRNVQETVLCIEYWCSGHEENWTCSKEKMSQKAILEMEQAGICLPNQVLGVEVVRVPNTHPILSTAHFASLENLSLAGRHATFKWDGQADNILAGMALAEKIGTTIKTNKDPSGAALDTIETAFFYKPDSGG